MPTLNGPAEIVQDAYSRSVALAATAESKLSSFLSALNGSVYTAPSVNVQWSALPAPNMASIPELPSLPGTSTLVLPPTPITSLPTMSDTALPIGMNYTRGAEYASQLLATIKATLTARLAGGTGLAPAVEQAIWDRSRDRETQIALAGEQEVMRGAESFGFPMPTGATMGALSNAQRAYHDKLSSLSRDVAIKQAELEQQNLKDAISVTVQLESALMNYSYQIEQLVFQAAKALADNDIAGFSAIVSGKSALLQAQVSVQGLAWDGWKAVVSGEVAKLDAAAKQSAIIVDGYKVSVMATQAQAELYARMWEGNLRQYEAATTITMQAAKINADAYMHAKDANMEAAKVGAQVMSQQTASAWNSVATSASISGSVSQSI